VHLLKYREITELRTH